MFNRSSSTKMSITARLSTPNVRNSRPISLAKLIFTAWNELHAYFSASAVPVLVTSGSPGRLAKSRLTTVATCSSSQPMTVKGGW